LIENDAGLHPRPPPLRIHFKYSIEILAHINDDSRTDGLTGQARSAAARNQRNMMILGDLHDNVNVFHGARNHDAERLDLINAGVRAVEPPRGLIEADFALNRLLEMSGEGLALQFAEVGGHETIFGLNWDRGK
jgi:hypothetical protein